MLSELKTSMSLPAIQRIDAVVLGGFNRYSRKLNENLASCAKRRDRTSLAPVCISREPSRKYGILGTQIANSRVVEINEGVVRIHLTYSGCFC